MAVAGGGAVVVVVPGIVDGVVCAEALPACAMTMLATASVSKDVRKFMSLPPLALLES